MLAAAILAYIPSPPDNGIHVGSVELHAYGLMIALGVVAAVGIAQREWSRIGGRPGVMSTLAVWGVPGGLVGARLYSLATSWNVDTGGHVLRAFEVWDGGLGIWGGVIGGIATGLWGAHRMRLPTAPLLDCIAPAFPVAQAIGRIGNYFNQELFGWRSNLPWAVRITKASELNGRAPGTFQPTFLYELIWDLIVAGIVIWVGRRYRIRRGYLFAVYAASYVFGRFFIEYMRIDEAHRFFGLRLNDWSSIIVFAVAVPLLWWRGRKPVGDDVAASPLSNHPGYEAEEAAVEPAPVPGGS